MVWVVMILALGLFHGIGAREAFSTGADDGVVKDVGCSAEVVRGKKITIDGHDNAIGFGRHFHVGFGGEGEAGGGEDREGDPARAGGDERAHSVGLCTERAIVKLPREGCGMGSGSAGCVDAWCGEGCENVFEYSLVVCTRFRGYGRAP